MRRAGPGGRPHERSRVGRFRGRRAAGPAAQLLSLSQLGAQERRPQPQRVRDRGRRAEGRPHLVEGGPEGPHARDAARALPAAVGRRRGARERLDRGGLHARRGGSAARSRPRHRAPAQPHRVRQLRARPARRRPPARLRLSAGRQRLRLRQQRRRAVALAGAPREVPGGRRPHRARRDLGSRGEGRGPRARRLVARPRRGEPERAPGLRQERPHAPQRGPRPAPRPAHRHLRRAPDPGRRAARGLGASRGRALRGRPAPGRPDHGPGRPRVVLGRPAGLLGQDARVPHPHDGGGAPPCRARSSTSTKGCRRPTAVPIRRSGPPRRRANSSRRRTRRPRRSPGGASSSRSARRRRPPRTTRA